MYAIKLYCYVQKICCMSDIADKPLLLLFKNGERTFFFTWITFLEDESLSKRAELIFTEWQLWRVGKKGKARCAHWILFAAMLRLKKEFDEPPLLVETVTNTRGESELPIR